MPISSSLAQILCEAAARCAAGVRLGAMAAALLLALGWAGAEELAAALLPEDALLSLPLAEDSGGEGGFDAFGGGPFAEAKRAVPPAAFDPDVILAHKVQDPAIETVEEMTARSGAGGSSSGRSGSVGNWWDSIRDPAIRTVDEQTHGAVKPKEKQWHERIDIHGYTQFRGDLLRFQFQMNY